MGEGIKKPSSQRFDRKKCQRGFSASLMGSKDAENRNGFDGPNGKQISLTKKTRYFGGKD
jgi:hypothetical protein